MHGSVSEGKKELKSLLKIKDVSAILKVSDSWVKKAVTRDFLPYVRVGHLIRFEEEKIIEWIRSYLVNYE